MAKIKKEQFLNFKDMLPIRLRHENKNFSISFNKIKPQKHQYFVTISSEDDDNTIHFRSLYFDNFECAVDFIYQEYN